MSDPSDNSSLWEVPEMKLGSSIWAAPEVTREVAEPVELSVESLLSQTGIGDDEAATLLRMADGIDAALVQTRVERDHFLGHLNGCNLRIAEMEARSAAIRGVVARLHNA